MKTRYQVFVSSTLEDLLEEREKVREVLTKLACIPVGMELFPAVDEEQLRYIRREINESDYYLLIIGGRYGSLTPEGISYTEKEYDYAVSRHINVIALLHGAPATIALDKSEGTPEMREKLEAFRAKVSKGRLIQYWTSAEVLPAIVAVSIKRAIEEYPSRGWTRTNPSQRRKIGKLEKENSELQARLDELRNALRRPGPNPMAIHEQWHKRSRVRSVEPEICTNRRIWEDGDVYALTVRTWHDGGRTVAVTTVHRQDFERRIGGLRLVPLARHDGFANALRETSLLAGVMSDKCMAAMIPADGQKTVIATTSDVLGSFEKRIQIIAEHLAAVAQIDEGVIVGLDIGVAEDTMDAISKLPNLLDHVTGLSTERGGLSIDRNGYTALGVVEAIRNAYPENAVEGRSVTIQGFGAVGAHTARLLQECRVPIRAVSNVNGVLIANTDEGLDASAIFQLWLTECDDCLTEYLKLCGNTARFSPDPNTLFTVPADIFVPAARTSVLVTADELELARREENPSAEDIAQFLESTGIEMVVEAANQPLSPAAEQYMEVRGVTILPDYIVNPGGLIGSWAEWKARHSGEPLDGLAEAAVRRIRQTVRKNVTELLGSEPPARQAAARILEANRKLMLRTRDSPFDR